MDMRDVYLFHAKDILRMSYYSEYLKSREEVKEITENKYREDIDLCKQSINELTNLWMNISSYKKNSIEHDIGPEFVITLTMHKIILMFGAILNLNLVGHYTEATALQRSIIEDFEYLLFFHYYPDKVPDFIQGKVKNEEVMKKLHEKSREVNTFLKSYPELAEIYNIPKIFTPYQISDQYSFLSKFVHPSGISLKDYFIFDEDERRPYVKLHPIFHPNDSQNNISTLTSYIGVIIHLLKEMYPVTIENLGVGSDSDAALNRIHNRIKELRSRRPVKLLG